MPLIVLIFTLFAIQPLSVQPFSAPQNSDTFISRTWSVEDGLPVNNTNSILQDEHGYIWFTTYDGIVRFDGINFKIFNHSNTPEIPRNRAVLMYLQEGTGLWITLENGGVLLKSGKGFEYFDEKDGFVNAEISYLTEDESGTMWFATRIGVYTYDGQSFEKAYDRPTAPGNRTNYVYEDPESGMWTATFEGAIHIGSEGIKSYHNQRNTEFNEFNRIHRNRQNQLLLGGRDGVFVFEDGQLTRPGGLSSISEQFVFEIYEDEQVLLVSTDSGLYDIKKGVKKLSDISSYQESFIHFLRDSRGYLWGIRNNGNLAWIKSNDIIPLNGSELPDYHYNKIMEDREGSIWLTTARSGILRAIRSKANVITEENGLSANNILGLFEDSRGRFWVGTRNYGLNVIDGNTLTQLRQAEDISGDIVQTINEDKEGNIWVGYYQQGLDKITDEGITSYDLGFEPGLNDVRSVFVSEDSTIWLGTYGGLVKFDPERENHRVYKKQDGLAGNLVVFIDETPDGGLWIGTSDGGMSYFKNGTFTNFTEKNGLSSNNIRSVYVDPDDPETIWVGTENNGLNRIRGDSIQHVGEEEGLPDHIIHYISQDDYDWLWMSSNRGVFKIRKNELNEFMDGTKGYFSLIHYGHEEGMLNPECNGSFQQGGLQTSNGTYWFATQEGVAVFEINPLPENSIAPRVLIKDVYADGRFFTPDSALELEPGTRSFEVNFHALTFVSPEKTRFRYRLRGYEEEWTEVINKRNAVYNDVPEGNYTFEVMASNNEGIWSEQAQILDISVLPLFYEEVWFYLLVAVVLIAGYYAASQVRYRYLMKKQKALQHIIDEQTAELRNERNAIKEQNEIILKQAQRLEGVNKAKDKFFSIIAHDLRNPFSVLQGFSDLLLSNYESMSEEDIKEGLREIRNSSKSLYDLSENLLNWARLQTGKMETNPGELELDDLIEKNVKLFSQVARQKNIELSASLDSNVKITADENMINTVVRNLMSNAIKFTRANGEVSVKLHQQNGKCSISIKDTGIGMPSEMVNNLMRLDINISRQGTNEEKGTGLGLLICKEMVALHNGEIDVESKVGEGTTFVVTLPRNMEQNKKGEE